MSKETVLNRILEMLNKITDTDYLPYLELMELIVGMEQEFHIKIPTRKLRLVATAEDLAGLVCEGEGIV